MAWLLARLVVVFFFCGSCNGFLLVVVGVGFGGWNGGGMVVGAVIMVVVNSRCRGGFVWWWLGFFAWWATISWISLEIGGVVMAVGSMVEVGLVCWWRRWRWRQEVMPGESYLEVGLIDIWFLQVVFIFGGLFEFWATEKSAKF